MRNFLVILIVCLPKPFYYWIPFSQSSTRQYTHLVCSQWQPRWRGLCQACFGPRHWTGMLSLAPSWAPPSSRGLQARVWKASHVDLNAPSSACTGARDERWEDRRERCEKDKGSAFPIWGQSWHDDIVYIYIVSIFSALLSSHSLAHHNVT